MSLSEKCRDSSERGNGKFTIVAYRESSAVMFRGHVVDGYSSELRCIECAVAAQIEEALVTLEKENLDRKAGQEEWGVRIYRGADLTIPHRASEDSDDLDESAEEVLIVDFAAIEAKAEEEHGAARAALMAVRMMQAHELAEKAAAEKEAKDRAEFQRLREKYSNV